MPLFFLEMTVHRKGSPAVVLPSGKRGGVLLPPPLFLREHEIPMTQHYSAYGTAEQGKEAVRVAMSQGRENVGGSVESSRAWAAYDITVWMWWLGIAGRVLK